MLFLLPSAVRTVLAGSALGFLTLLTAGPGTVFAQVFVKITDPANPVVTTTTAGNYSGAAWIDYDQDSDLDLFTTSSFLFRNEGSGVFAQVSTDIGSIQTNQLGNGITWADYDNDGDPDPFLAAFPSQLYRNDGSGTFFGITDGDIGLGVDNTGWTAAWADYNNDGFTDLVIVNPAGFLPSITPCHLFLNNGDGRFTKIFGYEFTDLLAPYTVGVWSDYDDDGDVDLFIGSGPAGSAAPDNLFRNMLTETGQATFERINTAPLATDGQDGQVWNWIDYDNDGDLDAYLTNYSGAPNRFYRNDGGTYVSLTNPLTVSEASLANTWGDVDNDGDLDAFVTNENGTPTHFYRNEGSGTFLSLTNAVTVTGATRGATLGDYDNDGDLDLFVSGAGAAKALFRNDTPAGNHWLNLTCVGTVSNASALGAKIHAKATISGVPVWQRREIQAQNSFDSHNSLRVHFGLGDATTIDSLIIQWPSGQDTLLTSVAADQFLTVTEVIPTGFLRANFSADVIGGIDSITVQFTDLSFTDPGMPVTQWTWDLDGDGIIDSNDPDPMFFYQDGNRVSFTVTLTVSNGTDSMSLTRTDYIMLSGPLPDLVFNTSELQFPDIPSTVAVVDTGFFIYNNGAGADSIFVSLDYGNVDSMNAIAVSPTEFVLAGNDSAEITFTIFTSKLNIGTLYRPKVLVDALYNPGTTHFEKRMRFKVVMATGIEDSPIPAVFGLEQNYPNPFNPETTIRYHLPRETDVSLKIYNTLGMTVKTLVNGNQTAGSRSAIWDGTNDAGQKVSSGVYVYRLRAGTDVKTKKMILIK